MTDHPTDRAEPAIATAQPDIPADQATRTSADGKRPTTLAPGLLMFNAESDNACTDDGCVVTFTNATSDTNTKG